MGRKAGSGFSVRQVVEGEYLLYFNILQAVLCDIASSMFIDLASEVELLDNHGVNSYRKLADERVLQHLESSSKERKEQKEWGKFLDVTPVENSDGREGISGERNQKAFFVSSLSSGLVCLIYFIF